MAKIIVTTAVSAIVLTFVAGAIVETETVEQKDWPDYFPDIAEHPSVYEPEFYEVNTSYVTPHTPWARPYYGGKIRALVVAPRMAQRDTVELAQRLDMDFDVICAFSRLRLGGSQAGRYDMPVSFSEAEQRLKLDELLKKDYDVIIIGKMSANAIPPELQTRIKEKVAGGMGLVISYFSGEEQAVMPAWVRNATPCATEDGEKICAGAPFTALDIWTEYKSTKKAAGKLVKCLKLGKGRIVVLHIGGNALRGYLVPQPAKFREEIKLWPVDYYVSLAVRATAWAAGKSPVGKVECSADSKTLTVKVEGITDGWDEVEMKARDKWGNEVYRTLGRDTARTLPDLANGEYVADAIVRKGGKTLNWASTVFKIEKANWIISLEASPRGVKPNEEFTVKVKLNAAMKEKGVLAVQAEDMHGRLIALLKCDLAVGQDGIELRGKFDNPMSNLVRIFAVLRAGEKIISKGEAWLAVNLPYPADDFGFVCWDLASPEYNWYYARTELAKLGVDSSYGGSSYQQAWILATGNFHSIPYMTRYAISRGTPGGRHERAPCLSDPEYIKKEQAQIRKAVEEMSVFGASGYSLGDENDLSLNDYEVCFSPSCRAAFREYARKTYGGNLEAANAEWGVTNTSWDEIEPMPLWEARAKKQPARWVDFRSSMEEVFLKIHHAGAETIKSVDAGALVGFDGGFNTTSFTGYDWWKLSRILDVWGIYPDHLQTEILRSFHRPTARTGRWYGGYYNITRFEEYARWEPWYDLFHEMNNVWWFNIIGTDGGGPQAEDTMNPASFKPFPMLAATAEETREIKAGIGRLLLGCRRDADGIAILYSQASMHAATFYSMNHKPADSQLDFIKILEDLGYGYRFVSYEQVKDGILDKEKYRLLILPGAVALSKGEREQVKTFMDKGGKAIADDIPGTYDDHGKEIQDDAWLSVVGAKVNVIGPVIRNYRRKAPYAGAIRRYFSKTLRGMGIEPEIMIKTEGNAVYEGEFAVFKDGDAMYLGLLRDHTPLKSAQKAEIILPKKGHIYDLRCGKYLGNTAMIKTALKPGRAGLWAVLPEKAGELKLDGDNEIRAGEKVKFRICVNDNYRHVVRVNVFDADGRMRNEYAQNVVCGNGSAEYVLPLALNDGQGEWTIFARDILGGSTVQHKLIIRIEKI